MIFYQKLLIIIFIYFLRIGEKIFYVKKIIISNFVENYTFTVAKQNL